MQQFKDCVSLLTEMRLKEKSRKLNIEVNESEEVGLTILEPKTREVDPSAKVT